MKKKYDVVPFVSVGKMEFGMTKDQIEDIIGKPSDIIDDNIMGEVRVHYPDFILVFIRKKLVDVRFSDQLNMDNTLLFIKGINILETKNLIEVLSEITRSKPSNEIKGFINFYGLGINLAGFGKKKMKDKREVRFYSKGRKKYYELYLSA
ncbi:hypothetical protein [Lacinutrix sp. MEBiC02595]